MQGFVAVVALMVLAALLIARMSREQRLRRGRGKMRAEPTAPPANKKAQGRADHASM